ncbi:hypothetical protein L7F22_025642 [Adiantum nelumboides]|nr:hypothetical protein [Adiantum nelumboides]
MLLSFLLHFDKAGIQVRSSKSFANVVFGVLPPSRLSPDKFEDRLLSRESYFQRARSGMHKAGIYNENTSTSVFPVKNFMTRISPLELSQEAKEEKQLSSAPDRLFTCLHTAFPCFEVRKYFYERGDFSTEGHSITSNHSTLSTSDVNNGNAKAIIFSMSELIKATSNFSTSCKIGQGGFGIVYKGKLRDGTFVAIKRANKDSLEAQRTSQFQSEVNMLACVEHLNLVRLIGYLEDGLERILVEEYVANGNLREHLDGKFNVFLDLFQRLDIAIDVAHALTYLHLYADQPIIHRDVKSSNILLTENLRAKVADFGFSRTGPLGSDATHVSTKVKGTAGYLDPEYLKTYKLTSKSDVYAFGILLVELITGRRPIEQTRGIDQRITVRWAYKKYLDGRVFDILDPRLEKTDVTCSVMEKMFELAFKCSAPTKHDRPTMKEATEYLWSIRKEYQTLSHNEHHQQPTGPETTLSQH